MRQNVAMFAILVVYASTYLSAKGQQNAVGMVDLKAITPVCGTSPAAGKDVVQFASLVLARVAAFPNSENLKWIKAIQKATGQSPESEIAFASVFAQRINAVFDSSKVDLQMSAKLLKRLESVKATDLEGWAQGLTAATGKSISKIDAALAVVCADRLFRNERWAADRGALLNKRLMQLTPDVVSTFVESNPAFDAKRVPTEAPIALILVDALFPSESFNIDVFKKNL